MEKENKTVETIRLSMEILRRIPRKVYISAPELQIQLENANIKRDLRSIQRQLKSLSEAFDIECDMSDKPYGYRWKVVSEGFSLQMLSDQDALLLTLAEQHLRNLLPVNLMKSMERFFEQSRKRLSSGADLKLNSNTLRSREWLSKVRVVSETLPLIPPQIKAGVLDQISNALYLNRWLEVHYKNVEGKSNRYDVMPLGLAQQGPRLYLVCRFKGHNNERSLAVHRISAATVSPLTFERPKEFDLKKYDADGRFGFGEGKKIKLTFMIDKKVGQYILESPLSTDQKVETFEDGFQISATVVDTGHLRWWLHRFEDDVWDIDSIEL